MISLVRRSVPHCGDGAIGPPPQTAAVSEAAAVFSDRILHWRNDAISADDLSGGQREMPGTQTNIDVPILTLRQALEGHTVEELKWYARALLDKLPTRKGELVTLLFDTLTNPTELRRLWGQLGPAEREVVAEVVHHLGGRYDAEIIEAKYPGVLSANSVRRTFSYSLSGREPQATPLNLFFYYDSETGGMIVPAEVAKLLRSFAPPPPPTTMRASDEPPTVPVAGRGNEPEPAVTVTETERAVFPDLATTLYLIGQGKISVGATTRQPTLGSLRLLRERLLIRDYFPDEEYERAEDAIRPFALVILVQAAKWAAPAGSSSKLALTKSGQAVLARGLQPEDIREAWERWLSNALLDELSRIRAIKGQQSKGARLTKPAERRNLLAETLGHLPVDRWVELDDLFRYIRAEGQSPDVERNEPTHLHVGSSFEYGWLGYAGVNYWDIVIGSYLRVVLWEYAATLGLIDIAFTRPDETPHQFGTVYGLDDWEYLSRYDGLLGLRLTQLGAYVLGLSPEYKRPPAGEGPSVLKLLPTLDVVIVNTSAVTIVERAFLERIGTVQSQDVYRLGRKQILEAIEHGLTLNEITEFLASKSGLPEASWPQTLRVFLKDIEQRVGMVREKGRVLVLESDDPFILTELAHAPSLRGIVRLATVDDKPVLLVPEQQETAVRRQLLKLGYIPRSR
ncbi:MAG: hypothetical protein EPO21_09855 [Chloroflexota bacterium]|nr:MAG: hypothetical protein EPO21_09855 [Chloroflexota bacterium]